MIDSVPPTELRVSDGTVVGTRKVAEMAATFENTHYADCPCITLAAGGLYFDRQILKRRGAVDPRSSGGPKGVCLPAAGNPLSAHRRPRTGDLSVTSPRDISSSTNSLHAYDCTHHGVPGIRRSSVSSLGSAQIGKHGDTGDRLVGGDKQLAIALVAKFGYGVWPARNTMVLHERAPR
ncbi:MAG: hypothetical protein U0X20_02070 [Caldilineaceae bacterium]